MLEAQATGIEEGTSSEGAPILGQLLIQQAALCWLKLNLLELRYSSVMKQSITLTLGVYWEKRLKELGIKPKLPIEHIREAGVDVTPLHKIPGKLISH